MAVPHPILRRTPSKTRTEQIAEVVAEALTAYSDVLNSKLDIRSVTIDIKMRSDGQGARVAIISFEGELEFTVRRG